MKLIKFLVVSLLLAVFAACGGGGGSSGATAGSTSTNGGGTTTGSTGSVPSVALSIFNQAGTEVSSVSVGGGNVARATVNDAAGVPVANKLVTFDLGGSSIALIDPTTALTNASGVAEIAIAPASLTSKGAASLSVQVDVNGVGVSKSIDFSVSAASLSLSPITAGSTSLPSGGNTSVQVSALVGGVASTAVPVNVTYTASCGRINGSAAAGGVSVTTDGSGVASAVYSAVASDGSLCSGAVTVSASSAGANASQSILLMVAVPTAKAVTFISALPAQIFVAGSGAVDQAIVRFKVLSTASTPLPNVTVNFSILTNPGGVTIGASTATTDTSGEVGVSVFSGTIPGPVKLRAALDSDANVFAESQNLTVASGPPSQRFMSLSVSTFNIEGWNIDGTGTKLTARIADRQGNAVADGTVVNFTAEGGQVASSCATTRVNNISSCSVDFISQNSRPVDGRVSVLAYTEGTKDYIDVNSNNRYDAGTDTLLRIGDAYRDDNENASFESGAGEFLIPRSGSALCAGSGAPFPSRTNTCDDLLSTTVRQQATIMFSSSSPTATATISRADISVPDGTGTKTITIPTSVNLEIGSEDHPFLPMPAGTKVAATAVDSNSADGATCSVSFGPTGTPIPNISPTTSPLANLATRHLISLKDCRAGDGLYVDVTAPSGLKTTISVPL